MDKTTRLAARGAAGCAVCRSVKRWWLNRRLQAALRDYQQVSEDLSDCYQSGGDAFFLERTERDLLQRVEALREAIKNIDGGAQ